MERRNFIKILGVGGVVAAATPLVAPALTNRSDLPRTRPSHTYSDIKRTLLSYAMLSANPHNTQAWKVAFPSNNRIELYVDEQRLLPQTDPVHRQIHIGQGAFIEGLCIAASHFGLQADVDYFPQGQYSNTQLEHKPVAGISLIPAQNVKADPLFTMLTARQSTKSAYTEQEVSQTKLQQLKRMAHEPLVKLRFIDAKQDNGYLSGVLGRAMEIEEQDRKRSLETINMWRFDAQEVARYRDGFGLEQNGITGIKRWMAESFFLSRETAEREPQSFGEQGIEHTKTVAKRCTHFGLIVSDGNSRLDQIKCGRYYQRLNLMVNAMGIVMHPMSQVLQEYQDMLPLQGEFKRHYAIEQNQTVQMLFRLGHAPLNPASARREVRDIIV